MRTDKSNFANQKTSPFTKKESKVTENCSRPSRGPSMLDQSS